MSATIHSKVASLKEKNEHQKRTTQHMYDTFTNSIFLKSESVMVAGFRSSKEISEQRIFAQLPKPTTSLQGYTL